MIYTVTKTYTDNATLATNLITAYKGDNLANAITAMHSDNYDYIRSDIRDAKGVSLLEKIENAWHCGNTPHDCPNLEIIDTITETAHVAGIEHDVTLTLTREYSDEEYSDRVATIRDIMRACYTEAGFTTSEANEKIESDAGSNYVWLSIAQFQDDQEIIDEMRGFAAEEFENRNN